MGRNDEAFALVEKALQMAKSSTPPASHAQIVGNEDLVKKWKAKKS